MPSQPPRPPRRSAERATHSSCPIRGPAVPDAPGTASSYWLWVSSATQTFLMSGLPKRPCGRNSMKVIRITNTSRSDQRVEM